MERYTEAERKAIRVVIAGDSPDQVNQIQVLLEQSLLPLEVAGISDTRGCLAKARELGPDVVLALDPESNVPAAELSRQIYQAALGTATIILASEALAQDPDYMRRAMQNKASDVLPEKPLQDALARSIMQAASIEGRRPAAARRGAQLLEPVGGRLVVLHGPKGGVGKSFLASNLAVLVAREHPELRVGLVDLDLRFGDQAVLLDLSRTRSALDLLSVIGELTPDAIATAVTRHSSGVDVLLPPPEPDQADLFSESSVREILLAFKQNYDLVLVDTATQLSELTLTALELADQILMVLTPDVLSIWKTRGMVQFCESLGIPIELIKLVINQASKKSEVKPQDVRALFECEILGEVPEDLYALQPYVNTGTPVVEAIRKGPVVDGLRAISAQLVVSVKGAA